MSARRKQVAFRHRPSSSTAAEGNDRDGCGSTPDQMFMQELTWCLKKLESQMKLPSNQSKQMEKAWKSLSNPHTVLVKKRQIMRSLFGDYRAAMEQEEKEFAIRPQGMSLAKVPTKNARKSKYLKSSSRVAHGILSTADDFKFTFSISDDYETSAPASGCQSQSFVSQDKESEQADTCQPAQPILENYYHMKHSKQSEPFTFNFTVDSSSS
ncbi:UPF0488 protein CG14286-like [Watersipora subatra]|uniref:UPF0488 protein CG14286-like n=1 Tax=Watersipora subatra TaxID=2589382 RepID=UPI00355C956C